MFCADEERATLKLNNSSGDEERKNNTGKMKRKEIAFSTGKEYTLGLEGRSGMRRWKEKFIGVCVAVKLNYFNFLSFFFFVFFFCSSLFLLWRICGDILYIFFFASLQHAATFQTSSKALSGTLKTIFFLLHFPAMLRDKVKVFLSQETSQIFIFIKATNEKHNL